jgi:hypothetical protein
MMGAPAALWISKTTDLAADRFFKVTISRELTLESTRPHSFGTSWKGANLF